MIKIKDYIFNENEIEYIKKELEGIIVCPKAVNVELKAIENATFDDIEWNYGGAFEIMSEEEQSRQFSHIPEPDYRLYEITGLNKKIKELEEENKRLELENEKHKSWVNSLNKDNHKFRDRINKAIEYIENMPYAEIPDDDYENNHKMVEWNDSDLLKILKGEEK